MIKNNLNLIRQNGGVTIYNPFINENMFVKMEYDKNKNEIYYSNIYVESNIFTIEQKKDIDSFINFIFPFFRDTNGKIIGPDAIKELEQVSAGSFGITFNYGNILIKILKIDFMNIDSMLNEINISIVLFFDKNGDRYTSIPDSINNIYGFLTSNPVIWNNLSVVPHISDNFMKHKLYTNLNNLIDFNKLFNSTKNFEYMPMNLMNGNIAILIIDKADTSFSNYIELFNTNVKNIKNKLLIIQKFYKDMYKALNYIHNTRLYIHDDIKPDNIVVKLSHDINKLLFQIIDFGLLKKISSSNDNLDRISATLIFMSKTNYEFVTNILYDWHCILLSILLLLKIVTYHTINTNEYVFLLKDGVTIFEYNDTIKNIIIKELKDYFVNNDDIFTQNIVSIIMHNYSLGKFGSDNYKSSKINDYSNILSSMINLIFTNY